MREWLIANWGNVASVLGLLLSIPGIVLAWVSFNESRRAIAAVKLLREKQSHLRTAFACERAIEKIRGMLQSTSKSYSRKQCDDLRISLLEILHHGGLTPQDGDFIKAMSAGLYESIQRSESESGKFRRLEDFLRSVREIAVRNLEEKT